MERDWVSDLFIEHGELFQVFLEDRFARAEEEARGLVHLFEAHGVEPGAAVLDLNCGIGRRAIHLAKLGYQVVGVGISPRFIARAVELALEHSVQDHAEFLVLDARNVVKGLPGREFDAIINIFTSMGYYDEASDEDILRQ